MSSSMSTARASASRSQADDDASDSAAASEEESGSEADEDEGDEDSDAISTESLGDGTGTTSAQVLLATRTRKCTLQAHEKLQPMPKEFPQKPMVELIADSNIWYQAYILKESLNEVKLLFPGVPGAENSALNAAAASTASHSAPITATASISARNDAVGGGSGGVHGGCCGGGGGSGSGELHAEVMQGAATLSRKRSSLELIEWVRKDSCRVWCGSYRSSDWRHLGKGAWTPRAAPGKSNRRRATGSASRAPRGKARASSSHAKSDSEQSSPEGTAGGTKRPRAAAAVSSSPSHKLSREGSEVSGGGGRSNVATAVAAAAAATAARQQQGSHAHRPPLPTAGGASKVRERSSSPAPLMAAAAAARGTDSSVHEGDLKRPSLSPLVQLGAKEGGSAALVGKSSNKATSGLPPIPRASQPGTHTQSQRQPAAQQQHVEQELAVPAGEAGGGRVCSSTESPAVAEAVAESPGALLADQASTHSSPSRDLTVAASAATAAAAADPGSATDPLAAWFRSHYSKLMSAGTLTADSIMVHDKGGLSASVVVVNSSTGQLQWHSPLSTAAGATKADIAKLSAAVAAGSPEVTGLGRAQPLTRQPSVGTDGVLYVQKNSRASSPWLENATPVPPSSLPSTVGKQQSSPPFLPPPPHPHSAPPSIQQQPRPTSLPPPSSAHTSARQQPPTPPQPASPQGDTIGGKKASTSSTAREVKPAPHPSALHRSMSLPSGRPPDPALPSCVDKADRGRDGRKEHSCLPTHASSDARSLPPTPSLHKPQLSASLATAGGGRPTPLPPPPSNPPSQQQPHSAPPLPKRQKRGIVADWSDSDDDLQDANLIARTSVPLRPEPGSKPITSGVKPPSELRASKQPDMRGKVAGGSGVGGSSGVASGGGYRGQGSGGGAAAGALAAGGRGSDGGHAGGKQAGAGGGHMQDVKMTQR